MRYHAVLFDLDGTLLDTLEDLADSTNAALRAQGFPEHPLAAYRYFIGDGVENLVRRALPPERLDAASVARLAEAMRGEYFVRWAVKTRPFPAIPELLDALTARGLPMAVLSNKPDNFTRLCVLRLLPRWRFEVVLGADAGMPKKPDPAAARRSPRDCICLPPRLSISATPTPTCRPPSPPACTRSAPSGVFAPPPS